MPSFAEVFDVKVTTRAVSRVAATGSSLLRLFGMQSESPTIRRINGRDFSYDIFNASRSVATGRGPGAPAATVNLQPTGRVSGTLPRLNEKMILPYEKLNIVRRMGTANEIDEAGLDYTRDQQTILGQRAANFRLLQLAGMMRGKLYAHQSGEDIYYDFTSSSSAFNIDWQIPSGNLLRLNMLGGGNIIDKSWADPTADIPGHAAAIRSAIVQLTGRDVRIAMCGLTMWEYIKGNDNVQAKSGIASVVFESVPLPPGVEADSNGQPISAYRLSGIPELTWIVTDQGLTLGSSGSTYTKLVGDTDVWFGPAPNVNQFQMHEGSETVVVRNNPTLARGLFAWTKQTDDPAAVLMYTVDNVLIANYVPAATAYATPIF